jgi:hypothetical protein
MLFEVKHVLDSILGGLTQFIDSPISDSSDLNNGDSS